MSSAESLRECLRQPIPEIAEAARLLDSAVSAHLSGDSELASKLLVQANMQAIRDWTESLRGLAAPSLRSASAEALSRKRRAFPDMRRECQTGRRSFACMLETDIAAASAGSR